MNSYIRTFAEVNLDAIEHNFNELKSCVNDDVKLCAVIKADGYGHGAVTLAELLKDKADYFAVATVDEAVELRNAGVKLPILILSYVHPDDFEAVINNEIAITCFSKDNALKYNETAKCLNKKGLMHIAIDTGMTRIGFALNDESVCDIKDIFDLENISICGVFSHYACADMTDKSTSKMQTERYKAFVKKCEDKGVVFPIHHLCNSAGIAEFSEHFDMVRMGISLYGLYPKKKHNKKYETPKNIGEKWQIDAKYVPNECKVKLPEDKRYYQYTGIDEASRERFIWWYEELTPTNTVDFVKRCIEYFGYKPRTIQTDNGTEFSYNQAKIKKEHPMDMLLNSLNIKHYKIRPRTPEHNGKVERSHRNDNERFYSYLKFYSLEDLIKQGRAYLKRSNNIPMAVLGYLTPKEKRAELELAVA